VSEAVLDLALLAGVIAIGFLVAVAFYESLCNRDVLVGRAMRLAHRVSRRRWVHGLTYVVTVGVGIPVLLLVWTFAIEITLLFIGSTDRVASISLVAAAIVVATRILAYLREKTAHELAKAIPLSFAIILLTGGSLNVSANLEALLGNPASSALRDDMVAFVVGIEIAMRIVTDTTTALLAWIRRRRGIDSDRGIWRSLWASIRRPVKGVLPGPPPAPEG
jgi:hypothetical protein